MTNRRSFITGLLAAGLCPKPTWADAGSPAFLTAGKKPDQGHVLCGLGQNGQIMFELPIPARGHAAAAHPRLAQAVAFARRPGRFALVIDCVTGQEKARLDAPAGRHFYGHGAFSEDGTLLFTAENDYEAARGVIGVWNAARGYERIAEFASGGVGPHDVKLMPDGETLVVANGGIETHPDTGRTKLNIPTMRPNLAYLDLSGRLLETVRLDDSLHKNSIRHLGVGPDGAVYFAMQWQGDISDRPPLLARHKRGAGPDLIGAAVAAEMVGYAGSIAVVPEHGQVAISSPRGGVVQVFDTDTLDLVQRYELQDVCGISAGRNGLVLTTGTGKVLTGGATRTPLNYPIQWDNHLVQI